jgi:hypothetical protein
MTAPEYDATMVPMQPPPQPATLYGVIDSMRERPAMYLGEATLTALWRFINGYEAASHLHGIEEERDPPFGEFHEFCARYFQSSATAGWCAIILADNFGQEEQALRQFFPLFDEFRARVDVMHGRRVVTAFAREISFNQAAWCARLPEFERTLEACRPTLCSAYFARIAHEYDAVLRDLERIAEQDAGVAAVLAVVLGADGVRTAEVG